jgi:hypothetical protein
MKIADYISKCIQEYPSLYKDLDYERSKMKVLCQIFFTNGNGLKMAETEDPSEGGYVVDPKYKRSKETGDWIRRTDKPYGKEKYKKLPDSYFDDVVYYVYTSDYPIETIYRKGERTGDKVYFRYDKKTNNPRREPKLYEAKSDHKFSPYPFSKGYCIACDVFYNNVFLQSDWMDELIVLCERTLVYFNSKDEYTENVYYPTDHKIKGDLKYFNEKFEKDGINGVKDLRKIWGYEDGETVPDYEEIEQRKNKAWEKFHKEQLEFLTKFLEKYDKQS